MVLYLKDITAFSVGQIELNLIIADFEYRIESKLQTIETIKAFKQDPLSLRHSDALDE